MYKYIHHSVIVQETFSCNKFVLPLYLIYYEKNPAIVPVIWYFSLSDDIVAKYKYMWYLSNYTM